MARSIVMLKDALMVITIKCSERGQHVNPEHFDVLVLPHGSFTPIQLANPEHLHATPHHQGAPSVLDCGNNAMWAESFTYPPSHECPLCPTDTLETTFIGPQDPVPLLDSPVPVGSSELEPRLNVSRPQQRLLRCHTASQPCFELHAPLCAGRH